MMKKILVYLGIFVGVCGVVSSAVAAPMTFIPQSVPAQTYVIDEQKQKDKPVVAYVLGSGGSRGFAHIGVLEVLEQHGIYPDFIVGTSVGSLVGVLYASGKRAEQVSQLAHHFDIKDVRKFSLSLQGVFDGQKVEDFVNEQVQWQNLEQLKIPMYVVSTRLDNGEKVIFNAGNTGKIVRASIAIPTMFQPVKVGNYEYVDGGLVSPVPVEVAKNLGADMVIAVNILSQPHYTDTTHLWGLFNQNINIMQYHLAHQELKYADIVITPDIKDKQHIFDVTGRSERIAAGRNAALEKINDIKQRLSQLQQQFQQQQNHPNELEE